MKRSYTWKGGKKRKKSDSNDDLSKKGGRRKKKLDLDEKVSRNGGKSGYILEHDDDDDDETERDNNDYEIKKRIFTTPSNNRRSYNVGQQEEEGGKQQNVAAKKMKNPYLTNSCSSKFTLSSGTCGNGNGRPTSTAAYSTSSSFFDSTAKTKRKKRSATSTSTTTSKKKSSTKNPNNNSILQQRHHIVTAICENQSRETCLATIDASLGGNSGMELQITKTGNGQTTYNETLNLLKFLKPDEILLNEGRRNSHLAKKIMEFFDTSNKNSGCVDQTNAYMTPANNNNNGMLEEEEMEEEEEETVVKFLPRHYFDQTRGAELLQKVIREESHDPSSLEEYIILASSHALLQYIQLCLGVSFHRHSLYLSIDSGGVYRMSIDRNTIQHLELLCNAKTGKLRHSLLGTIGLHTKTSVGQRLLRTNLIAPPIKLQTIEARLDLVQTLLEDEEFFYSVLEHLETLPDIHKMLAHLALVPSKYSFFANGAQKKKKSQGGAGGGNNGERPFVTARIASKGISALVCIKSILSAIPSFAKVIEDKLHNLNMIDEQQQRTRQNHHQQQESILEETPHQYHQNSPLHPYKTPITRITELTGRYSSSVQRTREATTTPSSSSATTRKQKNQLLHAILIALKQPALTQILDKVKDIFTESTQYSKNSHAMRHQECFALKPNTDGMMDVLRKAFLANIDDIYKCADSYAEKFGIPLVQVKYNAKRGHYLSIPINLANELPPVFIQPVKSGKFIHCTTEEVHSLNLRAQENVQDLLIMTHTRIQEVMEVARSRYDCLASLSDAIALLDMCHCFADNVVSSRLPWSRPIVTDNGMEGGGSGALSIRNGRYAIDVSSTGLVSSPFSNNNNEGKRGRGRGGENQSHYIPNDAYASSVQNFTIITGINGSGKSTYLKQLAIIVILAHCGAFVPAEEASIPVRDKILTRIGTSDDQEHNMSTFMLEMKETAFICANATDKSLILIDELGRATSNEDGVAIAWGISEFLLVKRAMTFFVTHYPQLTKLSEIYHNVQNQHLGSIINTSGDEVKYTHKIMQGSCKAAADYGVEMARICGWPMEVVEQARSIRLEVQSKLPDGTLCSSSTMASSQNNSNGASNNSHNMALRKKAEDILHDIAKHLVALKEESGSQCQGKLSSQAMRDYLQDLRNRIVPVNDTDMIDMMKNLLLNNNEKEEEKEAEGKTNDTLMDYSIPPNGEKEEEEVVDLIEAIDKQENSTKSPPINNDNESNDTTHPKPQDVQKNTEKPTFLLDIMQPNKSSSTTKTKTTTSTSSESNTDPDRKEMKNNSSVGTRKKEEGSKSLNDSDEMEEQIGTESCEAIESFSMSGTSSSCSSLSSSWKKEKRLATMTNVVIDNISKVKEIDATRPKRNNETGKFTKCNAKSNKASGDSSSSSTSSSDKDSKSKSSTSSDGDSSSGSGSSSSSSSTEINRKVRKSPTNNIMKTSTNEILSLSSSSDLSD